MSDHWRPVPFIGGPLNGITYAIPKVAVEEGWDIIRYELPSTVRVSAWEPGRPMPQPLSDEERLAGEVAVWTYELAGTEAEPLYIRTGEPTIEDEEEHQPCGRR